MSFFFQVVMFVVSSYISALLAPKPQNAQPGKITNMPLADAGTPIPVLFGTRYIKQPNVVWWGDVATSPINVSSGK